MVRAPLFSLTWFEPESTQTSNAFAYSVAHCLEIQSELKRRGIGEVETRHFRGLGSIDQALLHTTCIQPSTRKTQVMTLDDARSAIAVFGGKAAHRTRGK